MAELEEIAKLGHKALKTSRRDIAYVVAIGGNGATTVSATMFFAAKVGIPVFVTGGIGGVHRHGEISMDISSDLTELGRTPVAVVCAGVKSILDIPRTLEYLETQGVTVAAYNSEEFPALFFYPKKWLQGNIAEGLAFGLDHFLEILGHVYNHTYGDIITTFGTELEKNIPIHLNNTVNVFIDNI